MKQEKYKYSILSLLKGLKVHEHEKIVKRLPKELGVTRQTLSSWCYRPIGSKVDVPFEKMVKLSKIFNVPLEKLINYQIEVKDFKELTK